MKRLLLPMWMLLALPLYLLATEADVKVTLTEAGTLQESLSEYDYIDKLTVKGKFNSLDLKYLSEHKGRILDLYYLDLSDIEIVDSDEPYLKRSESTGAIGSNRYYAYYLSTTEKEEVTSSGGLHPEGTYHYYSSCFRYAFKECTNLKEVHLPKTMGKVVGEGIFQNCSNLEHIVLPEGCDSVGSYAFAECSVLADLSNTSTICHVGDYAFYNTGNLNPQVAPLSYVGNNAFYESGIEAVSFTTDLNMINKSAFSGCKNLMSLNIPGNVDRIGDYAFSGCSGLKTIIVGEGTRYLDSGCFYGCSNVETMSLPSTIIGVGKDALTGVPLDFNIEDGVQYVGKVAYKLMDNTMSDVVIREGTVTIADRFCGEYREFTSVSLPSSLKGIGKEAFLWAEKLRSVELPEGLEEIGAMAFEDTRLSSITIPSTVKTIGERAFGYCQALVRVNWNAVDAEVASYEGVFYYSTAIERIVFGEGVKRVPNKVCGQGSGNALDGPNLYNLTSVTFSSTIEEIGDGAFAFCTALKTINWPEKSSLKKIGDSAFSYTMALEEIIFPEGVETLGGYMFATNSYYKDKQTALRSVTIPSSVKNLGESFLTAGNDNIKEIVSFIVDPETLGDKVFFDLGGIQLTLRVPFGTKDKYEKLPNWNLTSRNMTTTIVEFGAPSAADIADIVNYIMGRPTLTGEFNESSADMNGDGVVNVADIVAIVNRIMGN